jgi:glycosyltransferase involved in cell wall biosynthesis
MCNLGLLEEVGSFQEPRGVTVRIIQVDDKSYNVLISVHGKFHAFRLASELYHRGRLHTILTGYPRFRLRDTNVPANKAISFPTAQLMRHAWIRIGRRLPDTLTWCLLNLYDIQASRYIDTIKEHFDIFVVWPDCCQRSIRSAKRKGAIVVVEAGSSHILHRQELLEPEYKRYGVPYTAMDRRVIQSQLAEYAVSDYIAVPSNFVRHSFEKQGIPPSKILQVPYGVDLSRFKPFPKHDRTFRVAFCGGVSLIKGIPHLLDAFMRLDLPDAELWLIGSVTPEMRPILARFSDKRIKKLGRQDQSALPWLYSQCDVFCLPSIAEGLGMVLIEAMACGLPVVCTTNTGADALIEDGCEGFVVDIRNVEALQDRIAYLYAHQDICRSMGQAARYKAQCRFTWQNYGDGIDKAYTTILEGR